MPVPTCHYFASMSSWSNEIDSNGWELFFHPDFTDLMESRRDLERILPNEKDARKKIIDEINKICKSKEPGSSGFPKSGHFKVLSNKKVPVCEVSITSDYRLLYYPTSLGSITIYAVTDHKGVANFGRTANSKVHNSAMDKYDLHETIDEIEIDLTKDDLSIEKEIEEIRNQLRQKNRDFDKEEEEYFASVQLAAIHKLGEHGIELKTTPEQDDRIARSSPMLLPGVAGTGKSTILQKRYVNLFKKCKDRRFAEMTRYLTFNNRLARETKKLLKPVLPKSSNNVVDSTVFSLMDFSKSMIESSGEKFDFADSSQITYSKYFNWWKKRQDLNSFDPALGWEDYRGVVRGSKSTLTSENKGTLSLEEYVNLPRERTAVRLEERSNFYSKMIEPFIDYIQTKYVMHWDDQDLARILIEKFQDKPMFQYFFIDEVQDLTEIQLLSLLRLIEKSGPCICNNGECSCNISCQICNCIVFDAAGDISQQVYPSRFRWRDAKQLIYEELESSCELTDSLTIGYRSVRSIVDLANWYLSRMENQQTDQIAESLNKEPGVRPSVLIDRREDLMKSLINNKLPLPQCPLLVRDERSKQVLIENIRKGKSENNGINSADYIFTIAEAKGLEFDYVLTWDITSGSDSVIKKKSHGKRGNYIDNDDWLLQMEYKHVFVAITRSRVMLLAFSPNVSRNISENGKDPHIMELFQEKLVVEELRSEVDNSYDLSRFTNVKLTDEQLEKLAIDYEDAGLFSAAAGIYRNIGMEYKAKECEFKAAQENEDSILMATLGRDLASFSNEENRFKLDTIFRECVKSLMTDKIKTNDSNYLDLLIFHARQVSDDNTMWHAEALKFELDARKNNIRPLFEKAGDNWVKLEEFLKAGKAYDKAHLFKKSAFYFNLYGKLLENLRDAAFKLLDKEKNENLHLYIGLCVPKYLEDYKSDFERIFEFFPCEKFFNLPPNYKKLDDIDGDKEITAIITQLKKEENKNNPEELAKINFEDGEITTALEIMRSIGKFETGFDKFGKTLSWDEIHAWSDALQLTPSEKLSIYRVKFEQVVETDFKQLAQFVNQCMPTFGESTEAQIFDTSISLITSPPSLDGNEFIDEISKLLQFYVDPTIIEPKNKYLLWLVRLSLLRIIHITESKCGHYSKYEDELLMRYTEVMVYYSQNPQRAKRTNQYNNVRGIVFKLMRDSNKIVPLHILYDWLINSEGFVLTLNGKQAYEDLANLIIFYNNLSPEKTMSRINNEIRPSQVILNHIAEKKFKLAGKKSKKPTGFINKILQYIEHEAEWWNVEENLWSFFDDIFDLNSIEFNIYSLPYVNQYEDFSLYFEDVEDEVQDDESKVDEELLIKSSNEVIQSISEEEIVAKPIEQTEESNLDFAKNLDTSQEVEITTSDLITHSESKNITEIISRYNEVEDPLKWLNDELEMEDVNQHFRLLYDLEHQIHGLIEDDKFNSDRLAASIWMLSSHIRKELFSRHSFNCQKYNDYQKQKHKALMNKLHQDTEFWKISWCYQFVQLPL